MSGGRGALEFFRERAEDTADALQDMFERSGAGVHFPSLAALGTASGARRRDKYLDTGLDKISQIAPQLASTNVVSQIEGLRRVVALISKGRDASAFLPGALKLTSSPSLEVRRLVYVVILQYAQHSPEAEELTLLSINSFQRDATDSSPLVRGMAIRVLTGLRNSMANSIVELSVRKASRDTSAYVRKVTALSLPRCIEYVLTAAFLFVSMECFWLTILLSFWFLSSADADNLHSYLTILSSLLGDRSPLVIGAAIVSFQRVFAALSQPVEDSDETQTRNKAFDQRWNMLHPHYRRICHALPDCDEWSQVIACEVLLHYARCNFEQPPDMVPTFRNDSAQKAKAPAQPPPRDADLDLLTYKASQLLHSTNASVVLSTSRLLYYLLPATEHAPFVAQLAALSTSANGAVEDRDIIYVLLINLLWLFQTGDRDLYQRQLFPLASDFWPRSDCGVSSFAPGSLALEPPAAIVGGIDSASAASAGLTNTAASLATGLGNLGALGQLGNFTNLSNLTSANVSAAVGNALTGLGDVATQKSVPNAFHMSTTTLSGATATEPIFAVKMELLSHLAQPENLVWLTDELEELVRHEWRESRVMHALKVLADIAQRWSGPQALDLPSPKRCTPVLDKWGVEARLSEIALGLLGDLSRRTGGKQPEDRDVADPFENPSPAVPLRPGVALGAIKILLSVVSSKNKTLRYLRDQASQDTTALGGALDEVQVDMFELLQHAFRLLYSSADPSSIPAGKRVKLVSKRNVTGAQERHILVWMLGECCHVEVEVEFSPPDAPEGTVLRTRKSAAELLGPELLEKAAANFAKEPHQTRLAIVTAALKIWAYLQLLNAKAAGVHPTSLVQVDVHTHHIFQQAWSDSNLDLHAHVGQYVTLVRSAAAWVAADQAKDGLLTIPHSDEANGTTEEALRASESPGSEGEGEGKRSVSHPGDAPATTQSHATGISPATLVQMLFLSNANEKSTPSSGTSQEFGSLALALGNREIFGSEYMRVPSWAAKGKGVDKANRDNIVEQAKAAVKETSEARTSRNDKGALSASAYEYVPDDSQLVNPSAATTIAARPSSLRETTHTATPGGGTPTNVSTPPLASLAGRMNPKYQDLDSFLDEPAEMNVPAASLQYQMEKLNLVSAGAPQDEEYATESDEVEYEDDDVETESSESAASDTPEREVSHDLSQPASSSHMMEEAAASVDAAVGSGGWANQLDSDDYESEHDESDGAATVPASSGATGPSWTTRLEDHVWRPPTPAVQDLEEKNAWAS